jgi:hypothetical protein
MTLQTSGAAPASSAAWALHAGGAATDPSCATRLSLVRGATGAAPCKAPEGGGVGGPSAVRGSRAPATGAVAPHPLLPEPLRSEELRRHEAALRSAGRAGPAPADRERLSAGRGAVNPLAALGVACAPRLVAEVTAPRQGSVARDGGEGAGALYPTFAAATDLHTTYLRPAPPASAGAGRGVPAPGGRIGARPSATNATPPAREAGDKEENQ